MRSNDIPAIQKAMKWLDMADAHQDANIDSIAVVVRYKSDKGPGKEPLQVELLPGTAAYDAVATRLATFLANKRTAMEAKLAELGITRT